MTRILSTLNTMEKSRFEAFSKSTLPAGNAIREYLAHLLLLHQHNHLAAKCRITTGLLGGGATTTTATTTTSSSTSDADGANGAANATSGNDAEQQYQQQQRLGTGVPHLEHAMMKSMQSTQSSTSLKHKRPLHDLVQPGEADSIVIVVSALAKAYAQRLVAAARRVADVMETSTTSSSSQHNGVSQHQQQQPLQVHHIQLAHDARVKAGIDPGFFMQRPTAYSFHNTHNRGMQAPWALSSCHPGRIAAAALGGRQYGGGIISGMDRHELLRHAALQAQQDYDDYHSANGESREDNNHDHVGVNGDDHVDDETAIMNNVISVDNVVKDDASHVVEPAAGTDAGVIDQEMQLERREASTPSMDVEPLEDATFVLPVNEKVPVLPPANELGTTTTMDVGTGPSPVVSTDTPSTTIMTTAPTVTAEQTKPLTTATNAPVAPPASTTTAPLSALPPPAPAAPSKPAPMSMEDALLMNLDDDSDDSDDD